MTESTQVSPAEPQVDPGEAQLPAIGSASSTGEPGSADEVNAKILATLDEVVARVGALEVGQEKIPQDVERLVQRHSDRRLRKVEMLDPDDIKIVADALRASDGDPIKAADALGVQAILEERRQSSRQSPPNSQESQAAPSPDQGMSDEEVARVNARVDRILSKSGLDDEARKKVRAEWRAREFDTVDDALDELTSMSIAAKASPAPQREPSPVEEESASTPGVGVGVGLPSGVGRSPAAPQEREAIVSSLYSKLGGLLKHPSRNEKEIEEVSQKLRDLGEKNI